MNSRLGALFLFFAFLALGVALLFPPDTALLLAESSREFASMHAVITTVALGVFYAIAFSFTIPITTVLLIVLGFLYGFWKALFISITATLLGSLFMFLLARSGKFANSKSFLGTSYEGLFGWATKEPLSYLFASRFAPLVPFPIAHLVPAEAGVRVRDFIFVTFLGTLPGSAAFVALGASSHRLVRGEPLPYVPVTIGLLALSILVFVALWGAKRNKIKTVLQEMQKTRSNQQAEPHGTTDA